MKLILNIIVLIFEVLYYSLFMKFARKEGNFIRYFIAFTIVVLIAGFTNVQTFISYALGLLVILIVLKYIVKLKVSLYDLLFVFVIMMFKIILEFICYITLNSILPYVVFYITFEIVKVIVVFLLRNKIYKLYNFLREKWIKNNFYIRYVFTTFMFLYFIFAALYLIVFYR